MKQSVAIIFSLGLLHYTVHGAPDFSGSLTTATNYFNGKINKTGEAIDQGISLTNGTVQLVTSLISTGTYMGTSTGKAAVSSLTTLGKEVIGGTVNLVDKELDNGSNLTASIPVVGVPTSQVFGTGRWGLEFLNSVSNDVLNVSESAVKAGLTLTNTATQLITGAVGSAAHGGAVVGKQGVQAGTNLVTSSLNSGVQAITGTSET